MIPLENIYDWLIIFTIFLIIVVIIHLIRKRFFSPFVKIVFKEHKRNKRIPLDDLSKYWRSDIKWLKIFGMNFQIGISSDGVLFKAKTGPYSPKTIQVKRIQWDEIQEITKKFYPGWGYTRFRTPPEYLHIPKIIGSWCLILKNGERHCLGLINKEDINILKEYLRRHQSERIENTNRKN